jgi:hypothetical protein
MAAQLLLYAGHPATQPFLRVKAEEFLPEEVYQYPEAYGLVSHESGGSSIPAAALVTRSMLC